MKLVIQRVKNATVELDGVIVSQIGKGLLIFLGVSKQDDNSEVNWLAKKAIELRIFEDDDDKMNLSLADVNGEVLLVPQFTLYGNCDKGRRPNFTSAAKPKKALNLFKEFASRLEEIYIKPKLGYFGEHMEISLVNDGPVTIVIEK